MLSCSGPWKLSKILDKISGCRKSEPPKTSVGYYGSKPTKSANKFHQKRSSQVSTISSKAKEVVMSPSNQKSSGAAQKVRKSV